MVLFCSEITRLSPKGIKIMNIYYLLDDHGNWYKIKTQRRLTKEYYGDHKHVQEDHPLYTAIVYTEKMFSKEGWSDVDCKYTIDDEGKRLDVYNTPKS
jgi:hypothetical protein